MSFEFMQEELPEVIFLEDREKVDLFYQMAAKSISL